MKTSEEPNACMRKIERPDVCPLFDEKTCTCLVTREKINTAYYCAGTGGFRFTGCPNYARAYYGLTKELIISAIEEGRSLTEVVRAVVIEELARANRKKG